MGTLTKKLNLKLDAIKKVGSILGSLAAVGFLTYNFMTSIAYKEDLERVKTELRIKDIEGSLYFYNQQDLKSLDNFSKQRYERLRGLLKFYETKLLKIQDLSDEPTTNLP